MEVPKQLIPTPLALFDFFLSEQVLTLHSYELHFFCYVMGSRDWESVPFSVHLSPKHCSRFGVFAL